MCVCTCIAYRGGGGEGILLWKLPGMRDEDYDSRAQEMEIATCAAVRERVYGEAFFEC